MKKFFTLLLIILMFVLPGCSLLNNNETPSKPEGFVGNPGVIQFDHKYNGINPETNTWHMVHYYKYQFSIQGYESYQVEYDVNIQVGFYVDDEWCKTKTFDFTLKGNEYKLYNGMISFVDSSCDEDNVTMKILKCSWK